MSFTWEINSPHVVLIQSVQQYTMQYIWSKYVFFS